MFNYASNQILIYMYTHVPLYEMHGCNFEFIQYSCSVRLCMGRIQRFLRQAMHFKPEKAIVTTLGLLTPLF